MVDNRCSGHIARAIFMRLARRSPLAGGLAELQHVHELLYSDDTTSMAAGSAAVRVWLNRGACPQAAEVSALLVEGILAEKSRASHMAVRSACSMALVRFVNSVADSFQTGMYAQSIGAIAERVDLPQWLVQVRHAATHEELPSLQVCRAATCVALEWLDTHYWQPSLAPMSAPDDGEELARRAAWATQQAQLLHAYRANARAIARDRSMARKGGAPLERTIAAYVDAAAAESECRIAYLQRRGAAAALGRSLDEAPASVGGACVASVLMACIAQLLLPGALIPAKEPRVDVALWEPLVGALVERFGQFLPLLLHALARAANGRGAQHASAWLVHLADTREVLPSEFGWDFGDSMPADAAAADAPPPWPVVRAPGAPTTARRAALLYALEEAGERTLALAAQLADESERGRVAELSGIWRGSGHASQSSLEELESRAMAIAGIAEPAAASPPPLPAGALPPGWHLPPAWLPTPIGCLAGAVPPLEIK